MSKRPSGPARNVACEDQTAPSCAVEVIRRVACCPAARPVTVLTNGVSYSPVDGVTFRLTAELADRVTEELAETPADELVDGRTVELVDKPTPGSDVAESQPVAAISSTRMTAK